VKFVDREEELARLDGLVQARRPGLVILWGRRRIGKTRLLLEWVRKHDGLYTVADLSAAGIQRRYFAEAVATRFPGFSEVEYPDWRSLLRALAREAGRGDWRGPLVLDEFPYWVESAPELPSVLQNFVDQEARDAGLLVAVSGSSSHMIQGLTLDPSAPLFGRASASIPLRPMSPKALGEAIGIGSAPELVKAFAVWGGVPRYWELAEPYGEDHDRAVEELVLDPLGPLHREPDRLLAEERPSAQAVRPLLDAIGGGAHRVSEIAGRLGTAATSLGRPLARLIELGLVVREQPFGEAERGGKRSLYKIADPFFRTWFRVVAPYRAMLAAGGRPARKAIWEKFRARLFAETWEDLCRRAAAALGAGEGGEANAAAWEPAGRFWGGSGPEWDVVTRPADGGRVLIGEARWSEQPVAPLDLERWFSELMTKGVPPPGAGRQQTWAVFVPRVAGSLPQFPAGFRVFEAEDVVSAIG